MPTLADIQGLTPEEKDQLLAHLLGVGGDSAESSPEYGAEGGEDAKYQYLCEKVDALEDLVLKLVSGFYGAISENTRKKTIGDISSRYGEKLAPVMDQFKDLYARDPFDHLLSILEQARGREDWDEGGKDAFFDGNVDSIIATLGKYPKKVETETIEVEPADEVKTEEKPKSEKQKLLEQLRGTA
jgi:hypothetical protein